jgi:hypothetical protein
MAARTASVSGVWSNTATWGGSSVPGEGDTVTINSGVTVTVDQNIIVGDDSATAAITNSGTLDVPYNIGADYSLTLKGNYTGNGEWKVGNSTNRLDNARTFTVNVNYSATPAARKYSLTIPSAATGVKWYGAEKLTNTTLSANAIANNSNKFISLSATPTGWRAGDILALVDEKNRLLTQENTIASITNNDVTLTYPVGSDMFVGAGDTATEKITYTGHGLRTGDMIQFTDVGTITGVSIATNYWVIYDAANTFYVAASLADALVGAANKILLGGTNSVMSYRHYTSLCSGTNTNDVFTHTAHGLQVADIIRFTDVGSLGADISTGTDYWVTVITTDTFKIALSEANALASTPVVVSLNADSSNNIVYTKGTKRSGWFVMNMSSNIIVKNYNDSYVSYMELLGTGTNQNILSYVMFNGLGDSTKNGLIVGSTVLNATTLSTIFAYKCYSTNSSSKNVYNIINSYLDKATAFSPAGSNQQIAKLNIVKPVSVGVAGVSITYIDIAICNIYSGASHGLNISSLYGWIFDTVKISGMGAYGINSLAMGTQINDLTCKYCTGFGFGIVSTLCFIKNYTASYNTSADIGAGGQIIEKCNLTSNTPINYSGNNIPLRITNYNNTPGYNRTFGSSCIFQSDSNIYRTLAPSINAYIANTDTTMKVVFPLSGLSRTAYVNTGKVITLNSYTYKDVTSTGATAKLRIAKGTDGHGLDEVTEYDILPTTTTTWQLNGVTGAGINLGTTTSAGFITIELVVSKGATTWNLYLDDLEILESTPP